MKKLITGYQFLASSNLVNFTEYGPINPVVLDNLLLITNVSKGQIIYNFADSTATGIANSTSGFLLGYNTTAMSNSDRLQIFYDEPIEGKSATLSSFTNTGFDSSLITFNSQRKGLTVFNEGAGNLHISPGSTCSTGTYQVRLSAGDYWECPSNQVFINHSACFATSGTARVTEII